MKKILLVSFLIVSSFLGISQEKFYIPQKDVKIATILVPDGWDSQYGDDFLMLSQEDRVCTSFVFGFRNTQSIEKLQSFYDYIYATAGELISDITWSEEDYDKVEGIDFNIIIDEGYGFFEDETGKFEKINISLFFLITKAKDTLAFIYLTSPDDEDSCEDDFAGMILSVKPLK
ncbi:MAG: hypothetical protein LBQ22_04610 [Bacteroidales bacterium]|jgi:hypothetical protein|nr:hypothetical protein [Bacteroidales bacterium]